MKAHHAQGILFTLFLAVSGTAQAGQCTAEIDQLQTLLSKSNAQLEPSGKVATDTTAPAITQQQNDGQQPAANAGSSGKPAALNVRTAQDSLTRARKLDEAGNEQACQDEMAKAKTAFGAQ